MPRWLIAFVFIYMLVACGPTPVQLGRVVAELRVVVKTATGERAAQVGGGVVVQHAGVTILLTAGHVVDRFMFGFARVENNFFWITKVAIDTDSDIAVAWLAKRPAASVRLSRHDVQLGDTVLGIGPTSVSKDLLYGRGQALTTVIPCRPNGPRHCFRASIPVGPGFSGTPVFSSSGQVVGVVTAYVSQLPNHPIIVTASRLRRIVHAFVK